MKYFYGLCCADGAIRGEEGKNEEMNIEDQGTLWTPCQDITESLKEKNFAVIILNCPINTSFDHRIILDIWSNAKLRITVDGGTKRWINWLSAHECEFSDILPPDLITGDMDSLSKDTIDYFVSRNSQIIRTPDQDETDFTKALREAKKHCDKNGIELDNIFVFGDTSGRFDQILANINTLFKATGFMNNEKIYQIAANSITWLLKEGKHRISIPECLRNNLEWCALIPIGSPCIASSTGLKWNLDNTKLKFGGMVSTSNTYSGENTVNISTDGPLIWSMSIESLL